MNLGTLRPASSNQGPEEKRAGNKCKKTKAHIIKEKGKAVASVADDTTAA